MKFVPCISSCAIHALLSLAFETWQSVQPLVSFPRTVCGTKVLKRLTAEAFGGNCLLLVVEPIAIAILANSPPRRTPNARRYAMPGNGAVDSQCVNVVAQNLKIVGGPVARGEAFVVQHRRTLIGGHRKMAPVTGRRPG